ncbi:MAG: hypothetical protein NCW75_13735 [Phycisphaera sp.]|nr:MAG: hypothetical protein NCW75_13735 [Phycisphaera sp.]
MTTVEVYAKFDSAVDYAFAAGIYDFIANEAGGWSDNTLVVPFGPNETSASVSLPGDPDATSATLGQIYFLPAGIFADPTNPALVWTMKFTATEFTPRFIDLETITSRFALYIDGALPDSRSLDTALLMEGSGQIQIIPVPSALACLGLAGLTLVRRRR